MKLSGQLLCAVSFFILSSLIVAIDAFGQSDPDQTIPLFNGKNLDGWYKFLRYRGRNNDPNDVFKVKDGMIHISGTEYGCITTEDEYENYHLVVEYMYDEDHPESPAMTRGVARDGGVLLHSQGRDGARSAIWMNSIEVQIIEGGTGDFIVVGDGTDRFQVTSRVDLEKQGASYLFNPESGYLATINRGRINWYGRDPSWKNVRDFRGAQDIERPPGEWNRLECVVFEDRITVYLNGVLVNEAINVRPTRGKIQIQTETSTMKIRKIDMTPLPSASASYLAGAGLERMFNGRDLEGWLIYGNERWYVDIDGLLICESGPDEEYGYLGTMKEYKDFDLTLEFLQEADGNSGVFFHSILEGTSINGWQAEVAPTGKHTGGIYESGGRGWLIKPEEAKEDVLKMGEWNTMRVRVKGNQVETWLNGEQMIQLEDDKIGSRSGKIALQIHSGGGIKVKWKNIWIKEI